jgi:hypothetical protein
VELPPYPETKTRPQPKKNKTAAIISSRKGHALNGPIAIRSTGGSDKTPLTLPRWSQHRRGSSSGSGLCRAVRGTVPRRTCLRRFLDARLTAGATWELDELSHAGHEHLDVTYVAGYDQKSLTDWSEDVAELQALGIGASSTVMSWRAQPPSSGRRRVSGCWDVERHSRTLAHRRGSRFKPRSRRTDEDKRGTTH